MRLEEESCLPCQVLVADFVANSKPGEGVLRARKRIALGELVRVSCPNYA
jgi:hypothetical protein